MTLPLLLDLDDIATLYKVPRAFARDHLTKLPEFPQPAPGSTRKFPRWRSRDVLEYLGMSEQPRSD